jgi:hypothetical protein
VPKGRELNVDAASSASAALRFRIASYRRRGWKPRHIIDSPICTDLQTKCPWLPLGFSALIQNGLIDQILLTARVFPLSRRK